MKSNREVVTELKELLLTMPNEDFIKYYESFTKAIAALIVTDTDPRENPNRGTD